MQRHKGFEVNVKKLYDITSNDVNRAVNSHLSNCGRNAEENDYVKEDSDGQITSKGLTVEESDVKWDQSSCIDTEVTGGQDSDIIHKLMWQNEQQQNTGAGVYMQVDTSNTDNTSFVIYDSGDTASNQIRSVNLEEAASISDSAVWYTGLQNERGDVVTYYQAEKPLEPSNQYVGQLAKPYIKSTGSVLNQAESFSVSNQSEFEEKCSSSAGLSYLQNNNKSDQNESTLNSGVYVARISSPHKSEYASPEKSIVQQAPVRGLNKQHREKVERKPKLGERKMLVYHLANQRFHQENLINKKT